MQPAQDRQATSYYNASWFSYLTFGWVNTLVETGVQRQVTLDDTPSLSEQEDALVNTRGILKNLDEYERARASHPLLRALAFTFWPQFLALQFMRVGAHFLGLLDPILMWYVLVFQEKQNAGGTMSSDETRNGFQSVSALIMLGFFMIFYNSQMQFFQYRLQVRIGSSLRGAVLFRCIQGQRGVGQQSTTGPSAYNVLSFDIDPIVDIIWIILAIWLFPVQFISTLVVLFHHVGWAVVPGLCTIITAKLLCGFLLYHDGVLRHRLLEAKDQRLRYCNEGFNNIRTLHMLAWRGPFQQQIMDSRATELDAQKKRLWLTKSVAALDYSLSMIVTFATLGYYVFHMGGQLKASVAIPVIQLIVNLMGPIGQIPLWINQYMVWRSAYNRLSSFIDLENNPKAKPEAMSDENPDDDAPGTGDEPPDFRDKVASLKDCNFSWAPPFQNSQDRLEEGQRLLDPNVFELKNLDLSVNAGQLLVIVGLEGQGKSSMLLGLLGEMTIKSGLAHTPAITRHSLEMGSNGASLPGLPISSKVARQLASERTEDSDIVVNPLGVPFSEQTAMLFTGSIRWNILFGSPYQEALYARVVAACALQADLATMPAGDLTEVAQAGATLSGGQKRRISIARSVYRAAIALQQQPTITPLVLLDDPLCSLDKQVAKEVSDSLFGAGGLLESCAVVIATADPWWVSQVPVGAGPGPRVALLRSGSIVTMGTLAEVQSQGLAELQDIAGTHDSGAAAGNDQDGGPSVPTPPLTHRSNPQGDEDDIVQETEENHEENHAQPGSQPSAKKSADSNCQTDLSVLEEKKTEAQKEALQVVKDEERDEGQVGWSTYKCYMEAVGTVNLVTCALALVGIMVFQNFCNLWIAYWTTEHKEKSFVYTSLQMVGVTPPTDPHLLLEVFGCLVFCFTVCNFAGHGMEIVGGITAARTLFKQALLGTFDRPFRWWDANPTGRVLNRFSEDVMVMDNAITNIMGVIFGAVLYFVGHSFILFISNPIALLLLPPIALGLEYYAKYYRSTIREVHRIFRVQMGLLYQDMLEAITGRITLRSFARENQAMEKSLDNLDRWQQVTFCKWSLALWLGLRMALIGYTLSFWVKLRPILQYYGYVGQQSAALVGFSMSYSTETVAIIQQFITNYSELEMQLISIERLASYSAAQAAEHEAVEGTFPLTSGLQLRNVTVTYRVGLLPALMGVSLGFAPGEVSAIVGRTGAGKSSLLLSILQLVPYQGTILVNGHALHSLEPEHVRRTLVGVVPQQPCLFEGDLRWNLDPECLKTDEEIWAALSAVGLEGKCRGPGFSARVCGNSADAQSAEDDESVEKVEFSAGQQQMLCAARVLLRQPKVAMLDEVASSLPAEAATTMVSTLVNRFKEHNTTVLLVTHQESLLSCCERVVRIAAGRVTDDQRL